MNKNLIGNFIKDLPEGARILDVGCGTGKTIKKISSERPDVHIWAMDMEDTSKGLPAATDFRIGMVDEIEELFKEDSFDAVICQHVIEHLLYPTKMMKGIKSVLKTDGVLFMETPNWTRVYIPFHKNFFWNDYTHIRPYSKETMRRMFGDYRFEIANMMSVSSGSIFVKGDSLARIREKATKSDIKKHVSAVGVVGKLFRGVFVRMVNPLLKDVLIVIGINRK